MHLGAQESARYYVDLDFFFIYVSLSYSSGFSVGMVKKWYEV